MADIPVERQSGGAWWKWLLGLVLLALVVWLVASQMGTGGDQVGQPTEPATDQPTEQPTDQPTEQPTEQQNEQSNEQPTGEAVPGDTGEPVRLAAITRTGSQSDIAGTQRYVRAERITLSVTG